MMSPVFGSIFAQTQIPISQAVDGATYVIQATEYYSATALDGWKDSDYQTPNTYYLSMDEEGKVTLALHSQYQDAEIWTVNVGGPKHDTYTFTSSTGKTFKVSDAEDTVNPSEFVSVTTPNGSSTLEWYTSTGVKYMVGHVNVNGQKNVLAIKYDTTPQSDGFYDAFKLIKVEDAPITDGLNELYNKKGFNFDVKGDLADVAVDDNLFNEEGSTIWAFYLDAPYSVRTSVDHGKELNFPKGTYFFSDRVLNDNYKSGNITKEDIDWLNSTFIAISSTEVGEATDTQRQAGQGFILTKVKPKSVIRDGVSTISNDRH